MTTPARRGVCRWGMSVAYPPGSPGYSWVPPSSIGTHVNTGTAGLLPFPYLPPGDAAGRYTVHRQPFSGAEPS